MATVVQDAVRRVPLGAGSETRGSRGTDDLTPVLRREGTLGSATQEALRRSWVTPGQDPGYRPIPAEQVAAPRREASGTTASDLPTRGGAGSLGASSPPTRGADASIPGRGAGAGAGTREAWRDGGVSGETRGAIGGTTTPRREAEAPLRGGFGRGRDMRGDDGWRSPGADAGASTPRTFTVPSRRSAPATESMETPSRPSPRTAAAETEPWRSPASTSPRRDAAPAPEAGATTAPRREAPAPRADEGWRGGDSPSRGSRTADAPPSPRYEPPARSSEPPARSYEVPRAAPAPRSEAPSRSYEAPRSAPAPRSEAPTRAYEAPRAAPAPRSEAPSHSVPSSPPSAPPPSRSGDAPQRSAPSRG